MRGRSVKEFIEYITIPSKAHVKHADYQKCPGTAFLKYTVEAKTSIDMCIRMFKKNNDGTYAKDSLDSLQHLSTAILPTIMSHFETYQKYLFAGIFDMSVYLKEFDIETFFKSLEKISKVIIDPIRLAAHRGYSGTSIGTLLADSLSGWHDPEKVSKYFSAFSLEYKLFCNDSVKKLKVLWQLRHSIAHTGGTLTLPDSQKVEELSKFGDQQIAFEQNFIFEVSRKLHPLVKKATLGIGEAFINSTRDNILTDEMNRITKFFEVKSSVNVWLR